MADLCRLCAAVRKKEMLKTINSDMCQKLNECFGIEICQTGDELPKCACIKCAQRLQETHEFLKKIKESQESLRLLYDVSTNKLTNNSTNACNSDNATSETIGEAVIGTSAKELVMMLSKTTDLRYEEKAETAEKGWDLDHYELYEVMESDDDNLHQSTILQHDYKDDAEHPSQLTDSNEEVETYVLEDNDDESVLENYTNVEEYEDTDTELVSELNPTAIKILPRTNTSTEDTEFNQITSSRIIQILEWKNYNWICHTCSESTVSFIALLQHAQEQHDAIDSNSLQYECTDCHKINANYHKFLNHVRFRHHSELRLRCDICDSQQDDYTQLANHRKSVCCEEAVLYPLVELCNICGRSFQNHNAAAVHARPLHNNGNSHNIQDRKCNQCGKLFSTISNMRAHEKLHTGKFDIPILGGLKKWACEICDRKFSQKNNIKAHLYTHINDKEYKCKVCSKNFKTPSSLENHSLIHKNIKKFTCDYCKKDFRTRDQKVSHERIHTGEKPFKCKFCDRTFRFRSGLMGHVSIHTGELPYSCQYCDRSFSNWGNMNKHLKCCKKRKNSEVAGSS